MPGPGGSAACGQSLPSGYGGGSGTGAYAAGCGVPQKAADSGADAGGAGVKAADAGMRFRRKCDVTLFTIN